MTPQITISMRGEHHCLSFTGLDGTSVDLTLSPDGLVWLHDELGKSRVATTALPPRTMTLAPSALGRPFKVLSAMNPLPMTEPSTTEPARIDLQPVATSTTASPIPMLLTCPSCHQRHIDAGEYASRSHRSHQCEHCGMIWRPANVPTVGVRTLPATVKP